MPPTPARGHGAVRLGAAVAVVAALALLAGGWLWLRQSSLVAVREVVVTGVSGPQAGEVIRALQGAGRDMTTLAVREDALRRAVAGYPVVRGVDAKGDFPHTLRVTVHEHLPVAVLTTGAGRVPVAADGTVLRDTPADGLPAVAVRGERRTRTAIDVLAAAPPELRERVIRLYVGPKGWTAPMADGPVLRLGAARRLAAKWAAAGAVLADPKAAGATYLDLRLPERPVAGGVLGPPQPAAPGASPST